MLAMKFLVAASLFFTVSLAASPLADTIVTGVGMVTNMSASLRNTTDGINVFNVFFRGQEVPQGFANITQTASSLTKQLQPSTGVVANDLLSADDSKLVINALVTFVQVHQALLSVVIGKHGVLAQFGPFGEPIRQALVALELVVDTLAFAIIALLSALIDQAKAQAQSLDASLNQAIAAYS